MFWMSRQPDDDKAQTFRKVHERWLNYAMRSGKAYPRIPYRRVDDGGFDGLLTKPGGRDLADRWWSLALTRVEADDPTLP